MNTNETAKIEEQLEMFPEIRFPEDPTTTHLEQAVKWVLGNTDLKVNFINNGPFVFGVQAIFTISEEGDKVYTDSFSLAAPMYALHEGMPQAIVDAFEEAYDSDENEEVHSVN